MTADTRDFYRRLLMRMRYNARPENFDGLAAWVARSIDQLCPSLGVGGDCAGLRRDGVQRVDAALSRDALDGLPLGGKFTHDGWGRVAGNWSYPAMVPPSVHVAHYARDALEACPELLYAATAPAVLGAITTYLGCLPTISFAALWWSLAGRETPEDAELFHRDFHDYRWVKLFIPLTDVDENSGPTDIIRGSHRIEFWRAKWENVSPEDRSSFQDMANAQRKRDEDIAYFFQPEEIETMTCQAGDGYLADTAAWHRGRLPTTKNRLMSQTLYTIIPDPKIEPQQLVIPGFLDGWRERYGDEMTPEQIKFVTRVVVT